MCYPSSVIILLSLILRNAYAYAVSVIVDRVQSTISFSQLSLCDYTSLPIALTSLVPADQTYQQCNYCAKFKQSPEPLTSLRAWS